MYSLSSNSEFISITSKVNDGMKLWIIILGKDHKLVCKSLDSCWLQSTANGTYQAISLKGFTCRSNLFEVMCDYDPVIFYHITAKFCACHMYFVKRLIRQICVFSLI